MILSTKKNRGRYIETQEPFLFQLHLALINLPSPPFFLSVEWAFGRCRALEKSMKGTNNHGLLHGLSTDTSSIVTMTVEANQGPESRPAGNYCKLPHSILSWASGWPWPHPAGNCCKLKSNFTNFIPYFKQVILYIAIGHFFPIVHHYHFHNSMNSVSTQQALPFGLRDSWEKISLKP